MPIPRPTTLDYETAAIAKRPNYPPRPAGLSIKPWGGKASYDAWAHPAGTNNCDLTAGKRHLKMVWNDKNTPLLFHHSKFDYEVSLVHMGVKELPWERIHDTLYLLFLNDPHARSLSLKPSAARLLNMPPEEQDKVKDWLMEHHAAAKKAGKGWGAYISEAPGDIVGKYANGDVVRTEKLFKFLYASVEERGMIPAYDRERQLMPIMLRAEQGGVRVDLRRLVKDEKRFTAVLETADNWLRRRLKDPKLNVDSDDDFGKALDRCKVVTQWVLTKTGKKSVAKKNLTLEMFNDKRVASVYGYRNRLATCLRMFMRPWIEVAEQTGGTVHPTWNQVRQSRGNDTDTGGARSGRFSSSDPNFQNISKNFEGRGDGYSHPKFLDVPTLPLMRSYLLPDVGGTWIHRDYSQQELRILAHYEDGPLLAAYLENPSLDVHGIVHAAIKEIVGIDMIRTYVKNYVFQKVYGGGIPAICAALHVDKQIADKVIKATMHALPGYKELDEAIKYNAKIRSEEFPNGQPVITWGGREYYTEPAAYSAKFGRPMTFEYKLLNYLIQGSAADCTKEALIRYDSHPKREARLVTTVHDEINSSSPKGREKEELLILKECMESVEFDIIMKSEGKKGPSWGDLKKVKEA